MSEAEQVELEIETKRETIRLCDVEFANALLPKDEKAKNRAERTRLVDELEALLTEREAIRAAEVSTAPRP